ncbi:hypothetical protein H257_15983 [Aphanomyces astaci]|uniref:SCP domain-containing protein n=1 Tax=Aphanomyces astaci TaxID=112090 RepID=W4FM14_APHAT|nr:hypothetical protein H257_15983 [Aphanomyces astaci]ETV67859.1 hypothetical protein H257_15983 [Aphanomyces astaci]|eukprot:XP_009842604.1 hypothetical protein H257_15983 [Aphanomyces astaci]
MASFQQWGCRARTLQGRRLLANTVMLSLLWHVTAALPVPPAMVQSWQSMLNRYILGRKIIPTDRYSPLLAASLQFDSKLGLGLPHVASRIRAQRLQILQRAMSLLPLTPATTIQLPVWLMTYEPTMSNGKCAARIVNSPPTRRWCSHGACNRLRCLADIVAVHGRWPTRPEFMVMMCQGNPAAPVERGNDGRSRDSVSSLPCPPLPPQQLGTPSTAWLRTFPPLSSSGHGVWC